MFRVTGRLTSAWAEQSSCKQNVREMFAVLFYYKIIDYFNAIDTFQCLNANILFCVRINWKYIIVFEKDSHEENPIIYIS